MNVINKYFSIAVVLAVSFGNAQSVDPKDPDIIADALNGASRVVVGAFHVDWCFPWIDGWHCRGTIHTEEVLYGDRNANRLLPFYWTEIYGTTCVPYEKLSLSHGDRGIWFMAQKDGAWEFTEIAARW